MRLSVVEIENLNWVPIYFNKQDDHYLCNVCQSSVKASEDKDPLLLDHMEKRHREIYELHKNNPDETVGFRIEFLQMTDLGDGPRQEVALGVTDAKDNQLVTMDNEVEFLLVKDGPQPQLKVCKYTSI